MADVLKQANFQLPEDLIKDIQEIAGKRGQSKFVSDALKRELQRLRLIKVLDASFGAWSKEKHPELAKGVDTYIHNIRKSSRGKRDTISISQDNEATKRRLRKRINNKLRKPTTTPTKLAEESEMV